MLLGQDNKVNWQDVKLFASRTKGSPNLLEICGGEWMINSNTKSLNELNDKELEEIKKSILNSDVLSFL